MFRFLHLVHHAHQHSTTKGSFLVHCAHAPSPHPHDQAHGHRFAFLVLAMISIGLTLGHLKLEGGAAAVNGSRTPAHVYRAHGPGAGNA